MTTVINDLIYGEVNPLQIQEGAEECLKDCNIAVVSREDLSTLQHPRYAGPTTV